MHCHLIKLFNDSIHCYLLKIPSYYTNSCLNLSLLLNLNKNVKKISTDSVNYELLDNLIYYCHC